MVTAHSFKACSGQWPTLARGACGIRWREALVTLARMTDAILSRAADGGRITPEEAATLYRDAPLAALGAAADAVGRRRYGDVVTYNVNAHLNPTNICVVGCGFCAFAVWTEKDERA